MQIPGFYDFEETVYTRNEKIIGLSRLITYKLMKNYFLSRILLVES